MVPNADRDDGEPNGSDEQTDVAAYEDGEEFVIREPDNPDAWLRSTATREVAR